MVVFLVSLNLNSFTHIKIHNLLLKNMNNKIKLVIVTGFLLGILLSSCKKDREQAPVTNNQTETVIAADAGQAIETLSEEYFRKHSDEKENEEQLITVTKDFLAYNQGTEEFGRKKPCRIQPIYAYGVEGVAYYEVWFTEDDNTVKGWMLVSATEKDLPLLNFSNGIPYSSRLLEEAQEGDKVYRFGVSYFVLERNGNKVSEYGQMPDVYSVGGTESGGKSKNGNVAYDGDNSGANLREGVDYYEITGYESLKSIFPKVYFTEERVSDSRSMRMEIRSRRETVANARIADAYSYAWVNGPFCYYTQIPPVSGYNPFSCYSGCNNNAWASLYGWWDLNRGKVNLIPTSFEGEAIPQFMNTIARRYAVEPVIMRIRSLCGTYCKKDVGMTKWSNMHKGYLYVGEKGYGHDAWWRWCDNSGCHSYLADIVTDGIANNGTPVIIGANSHMYVGYGWAQMPNNTNATWAYCYPAWQENHNDDVWIHWRDFNASTRIFVY